MKHLKLFFALFAMLALGVGNAWGDVTCDFTTKSASYGNYTESWKYGDFTVFGGANNNNAWAYVKMGGKKTNLATANPVYISSPKMTSAISKVQVSIIAGSLAKSGMSVNSWGVYVYSDANMTNQVDYVAGGTISKNAAVFEFTPTTGTTWSANNYYKVSFDLKNTTTTNGIIWVDKVTFVESTDDGGDTPEPTPTQLAAPTGLTVGKITSSSATLSWNAVANASNYSVTINGNTETVTTNSYNTTGLTAGTEYTWSVVAKGDGTNYTDSDAAQHTFTTTAATTPDPELGTGTNVTYDFTKIDGFENWPTAYASGKGDVVYTEATVKFTGAVKQTQTITDCPVTKGGEVQLVLNSGYSDRDITNVTFVCKQWGSKAQTITLHYSTDGGVNYTNTEITSTNFTISSDNLPEGTNAVKITFSSTSNQVGIASVTFSLSSDDEPGTEEPVASLTADPTTIDFGTVYEGATVADKTVAVNFANLTGAVTYSGLSTPFSATGDIYATGDNITISADASTIGEYSQTLTVASTADNKTAEVTVTMNVVAAPAPTGTFEKFTGTLEEGDYVLVANGTTDALKNTITSNRFDCGTVEVAEDKIVNPDKSVIWHIAANDKYWTMYNESATKYAGGTTSRNQGALLDDVTDLAKWTITVDGEGVYTFENYGRSQQPSYANNKFLSKNSQNAYWATYASGQENPVLYKKSDGKQPAGLVYETNKYRTKLGDSFVTPTLTNPNSLNVTYSSSNNDVAEVATDGSVTIKAVGGVEITATFAGSETHRQGFASYTLCVTEHAGTEVDPYSVADARRVIDVMETAEGVYATGIVSEIVTAYNSTYGNISYNISADGLTTSDQLQAYRGKGKNGENFSSADDIKVGDEVIVKGNLKKYETTYEFDADNQLVSLKREKQQAGLAYEEKEHTANVGEDFAEPTLTNPNSLTVTYSSSNTALATVNATTGEVSILAAGKVTITASSAADATYAAGSASYNITITDPSLAVAQLPFTYNSGKEDIETTAGITQEGLGSDYTSAGSPKLKFDHIGDNIVIRFGSQADELSYDIKGNPGQGTFSGTFAVQESEDGSTYTDLVTYTTLETTTNNKTHKLAPASRYVKFVFTEKSNGNVALGNISITKPDLRAEAGIAWNPATVSLTVGDAFTAPTFNNPNGLSGITFASSNEALATVNNAGAITLISGKTGTATITATFADGHADYKPAEVTCVITVSPKSEKVVILAQYNGQWYALKAAYLSGKTDRLDAIPVNYVGGKLYNVAEADKASIEWSSVVEGDKVSFLNDGKYLKGKTSTTLLFEEDADGLYKWDNTTYTMTIETTVRSFLYNGEAFRNFAVSNAGKVVNDVLYSSLPVVTAPVYATGDAYGRSTTAGKFGTICLPFGSNNYTGAEFYELVQAKADGVVLASVETLEAGVPYIFEASAAEVAVYGDGTTAATPGDHNGLHGTFTDDTEVAVGNYILKDNALCQAESICWVNAYRAYIVMSEVPTNPVQQMPGRRYIGMSVQGENEATGFENITAPAGKTVKAIVNGQLIIIRDGEMYNAQGQKL